MKEIIKYNKPINNPSLLFNKEKIKLQRILPKTTKIEHVGGTAVPSLGGKKIIDIFIAVPKKSIKRIKNLLEKNKYKYDSQWGNRMFFIKKYKTKGGFHRFNIHLLPLKDIEFSNAIILREYLKNNKTTVKDYIRHKKQGIKVSKGNGKKYRDYKNPFMVKIIKDAIKWNNRT
ncbi:GrpB family protein [archaeon]|nr:GrpB family protein [archaeon]